MTAGNAAPGIQKSLVCGQRQTTEAAVCQQIKGDQIGGVPPLGKQEDSPGQLENVRRGKDPGFPGPHGDGGGSIQKKGGLAVAGQV